MNDLADAPPRRPWPILRLLAVLLCVAGWWISLDLLRLSGGAAATNPLITQTCGDADDPESAFDCHGVLASEHGSIPLSPQPGAPRLPTAALGLAYFGLLLMWYVFVGWPTRWLWQGAILFILVAACLRSAALTAVMAFELQTWCSGCVAAHVINAALFLITLIKSPWRAWTQRPRRPSHALALATLTGGGALALLQLSVVLMSLLAQMRVDVQKKYLDVVTDPNFIRWDVGRQPQHEIPDAGATWIGDPNAPHELVVFTDMQCSACKQARLLFARLLDELRGRVKVSYRHFPQSADCNPAYDRSPHPAACDAAAAVEAARVVGGDAAARQMRTTLFERQIELGEAPLADWAVKLGLDRAAFERALASDAVRQRVRDDVELGIKLGVKYPPGIFLDGRRVRYWNQRSVWDELLRKP